MGIVIGVYSGCVWALFEGGDDRGLPVDAGAHQVEQDNLGSGGGERHDRAKEGGESLDQVT